MSTPSSSAKCSPLLENPAKNPRISNEFERSPLTALARCSSRTNIMSHLFLAPPWPCPGTHFRQFRPRRRGGGWSGLSAVPSPRFWGQGAGLGLSHWHHQLWANRLPLGRRHRLKALTQFLIVLRQQCLQVLAMIRIMTGCMFPPIVGFSLMQSSSRVS